jgi:hypothetical protein
MFKRLNLVMATSLAFLSAPAFAETTITPLPELITACGKNVMCSNQKTGEGTLFIVREPQRTQNLLCQDDGHCVTILAKGQRVRVQDSLSKVSAR